MKETFVWCVYSSPPSVEYEAITRAAVFGDGYLQEAPDGINNEKQTWELELWGHREADQMGNAKAFLRLRRQRGESFLWTPPGEPEALYRCTKLSAVDELEGYLRISCTFEQTFQP
ncbi:phage tail protein [Stenotrophomonas muris]|uniref:Phage tail protein n=1 Tax=Stenotrophomonas maltophilia TaxID=40324 RepID=A0AA41CGG4_STEMA|nr:phage tail protein [Stenotrophomonas muris]MBH1790540.1 phage tail protein [Stenotrophomonas maltophilia]MCR1817715.1 phage tail protein [Stenotrophomonas muris]